MDHPAEQQLLELLTSPTGPGLRHEAAIERLVAEIMGGHQYDLKGATRGPDILVPRENDGPIAVELKVLRESVLGKNLNNRVAELLAAAVESRRSLRDEVTLAAVLLIGDFGRPVLGQGTAVPWASALRRLLRSDDGVGYDSVLIGSADDVLQWNYFAAGSAQDAIEDGLHRLYSTDNVVRFLRSQRTVSSQRPSGKPSSRRRRILLVADEWRSGRGGISTVNRELAAALAAADVETAVLVPHVSDNDASSASEANVALVAPARIPGLGVRELLLLRGVFADQDWKPDFVIGHGRVLGPYAAAQQQVFFPQARRVHFVHTAAEQLEAAKEEPGGDSRMVSANNRRGIERDLAQSADLVVGVGPLLTATIRDELIGPGPEARIVCLVPGLRKTFDAAAAHAPVRNQVLLVGRADDFRSKGLDIAAEAMLRIVDRWPRQGLHRPVLVIRGVPGEAADNVKSRLDEILEGRVVYHLRPYSDSEDDLLHDLAQARVMLMPSRHEGFGLAAYEAIASGVPVLISEESGLAQFLRESGIDTSPSSIVTTQDTTEQRAIDQWVDAIEHVLDDPEDARTQAIKLRNAIAGVTSWERSVAQLIDELDRLP